MSSPRELVEQGSARALIPVNQKVFVKLLEQRIADRHLTIAAFAKLGKLNPTCLSTYRHAPPKQLYAQTVRKFLQAFGMTPAEAETVGLFPRAGKSGSAVAVKQARAVANDIAAMLRSVAVTPAAIAPPVRIMIADTELTVAPMAASVQPAVVEHLGWQLTVKLVGGATE